MKNSRFVTFCVLAILVVFSTSVQADRWTTIYTPNGSPVSVILMTSEMTSAEIASTDSYMMRTYPGAVFLRNSTRRYNCHSFAWYSTDSTNSVWINTPNDDIYWEDGSYVNIEESYASTWDRVSYKSDDHSALLYMYEGEITFISKWGAGPLAWHWPGYDPYDGRYYEIYTEDE